MSTALTEIPGWYIEFQAALLCQAPRPGEIDQTTAEGWINNQKGLKKNLAGCLLLPQPTAIVEPPKSTPSNIKRNAPVKISAVWYDFTALFLSGDGKTEDPISEQTLRYCKLRQSSVDDPIITELGGEAKAETTLR